MITRSQAVKLLLKVYEDNLRSSLKEKDEDLSKCYESDAKDIQNIAALVETRSYIKAYNRAEGLDTAVREQIPDKVWEFLEAITQAEKTLKDADK